MKEYKEGHYILEVLWNWLRFRPSNLLFEKAQIVFLGLICFCVVIQKPVQNQFKPVCYFPMLMELEMELTIEERKSSNVPR